MNRRRVWSLPPLLAAVVLTACASEAFSVPSVTTNAGTIVGPYIAYGTQEAAAPGVTQEAAEIAALERLEEGAPIDDLQLLDAKLIPGLRRIDEHSGTPIYVADRPADAYVLVFSSPRRISPQVPIGLAVVDAKTGRVLSTSLVA